MVKFSSTSTVSHMIHNIRWAHLKSCEIMSLLALLSFTLFHIHFLKTAFPITLYVNVSMWQTVQTQSTDLWVCVLLSAGPGAWRELQFKPNEWGHYVSAYNIKKLCKWICCYTTMLLLSKHKQHFTNGQVLTVLKYDKICFGGSKQGYMYTHEGGLH